MCCILDGLLVALLQLVENFGISPRIFSWVCIDCGTSDKVFSCPCLHRVVACVTRTGTQGAEHVVKVSPSVCAQSAYIMALTN